MTRSSRIAIAALWAITGLACTGGTAAPSRSANQGASPPEHGGPVSAWVAVFDVAEDPNDLEAGREQILQSLGDALDGAVVVSPTACLEGLSASFGGDGYVLAIQQPERAYVRALAAQVDGQPRFVGRVTVVCGE